MSLTDKQDWLEKINGALEEIRPHLAVDGGNVHVVDITPEFDVQVRWTGNCASCEMSSMTLRAGVEQTLKNKYPQIHSVIAVNGQT